MTCVSGQEIETMHHCAFCKNPLDRWSEWKGTDGRFYCSEFCAEGGAVHDASLMKWPELEARAAAQDSTSRKAAA